MKKSYLLAYAFSFLTLLSSNAQARIEVPDYRAEPSSVREAATTVEAYTPPRPEEVGVDTGAGPSLSCELSSETIEAVQFYGANCLSRSSEEGTLDLDLNLRCTLDAPVYRSLCEVVASASPEEGSPEDAVVESPSDPVSVCLSRYHCSARGSGTTPTPPSTPEAAASALASIAPTSAQEGGTGVALTVTGSNFTRASLVLWNGRVKTTSFTSATELHAQIDAADIAHAGSVPVTVLTGARLSNAVNFTISARSAEMHETPPPPRVGGISPETTLNPDTVGTATLGTGSSGGCMLAVEASEAASFSVVAMGFLVGSFFMLRRKKR